jgi:hypothetical protein
MRRILSERGLVVVLFILVFITFVFAQQDSKKMERAYSGIHRTAGSAFLATNDQGAEATRIQQADKQ